MFLLSALGSWETRKPCKAQVKHDAVLLLSGALRTGDTWGSCYLEALVEAAKISPTLQASDVKGVLSVLPSSGIWLEGSAGLSASSSVSDSLSYLCILHLPSAQFSSPGSSKVPLSSCSCN